MEKSRTVAQYRTIDLILFSLMLAAAEFIVVKAATSWFPGQPYTISVVPALTAIVMMRWGPWAALHAALGGAVCCLASGASAQQYFIYIFGNLLSLAALLLIRLLGNEGIRTDALKTMLLGVTTVLLMQLGRGVVSLVFGGRAGDVIRFFTTDVISVLFTAVVVWIARRLDGVFEDQINYLLRVSREREEEKENSNEG